MTFSFAFSRVSGALAAFVLSTALFHASAAHANIVFDFSGDCTSDCTGTATGVLTLADSYTFGADITVPDFISLTYTSSARDFELLHSDIAGFDGRYIKGGLNANGSLDATGIFGIVPPSFFPLLQVNAEGFVAFTGLTRMDKGSTFFFRREMTATSPGGDTGDSSRTFDLGDDASRLRHPRLCRLSQTEAGRHKRVTRSAIPTAASFEVTRATAVVVLGVTNEERGYRPD